MLPNYIKTLSSKAEFFIVISLAFGYSIIMSAIIFINYFLSGASYQYSNSDIALVSNIIYQVLILAMIFSFLNARESNITLSNNFNIIKLLGICVILILSYYLFYYLFIIIATWSSSATINQTSNLTATKFSLIPIILFSASNGFFEEIIVVGYVIPVVTERRNSFYGLNVSVFIRLLYHLYQGPVAALHIIPMGLVFGLIFIKYKNIWPLVIAHFVLDVIALLQFNT